MFFKTKIYSKNRFSALPARVVWNERSRSETLAEAALRRKCARNRLLGACAADSGGGAANEARSRGPRRREMKRILDNSERLERRARTKLIGVVANISRLFAGDEQQALSMLNKHVVWMRKQDECLYSYQNLLKLFEAKLKKYQGVAKESAGGGRIQLAKLEIDLGTEKNTGSPV